MTDLWDEAMKAAVALMNERAANWGRDFVFSAPMRSLLDRAEEAKAAAEAIRAIPRPPEADRHAAIVEAAMEWSRTQFDDEYGTVAGALYDACRAELAARAEKGDDACGRAACNR